jgi:TRAP-type C4-dicarboxylate transport system permease small subunit
MSNERGDFVLPADRGLKWRALDPLERALMRLCGVCLVGFTSTTLLDVVTRVVGHPLLWPQEVTSAFFVYGVFVGASVATRRGDHLQLSALTEAMGARTRRVFEVFNRLVVMAVGICLVVYGWQNFLTGFGSFRMPSMLPIAYLYAPIPLCGALVALFSLEQVVNGLRNGFSSEPLPPPPLRSPSKDGRSSERPMAGEGWGEGRGNFDDPHPSASPTPSPMRAGEGE